MNDIFQPRALSYNKNVREKNTKLSNILGYNLWSQTNFTRPNVNPTKKLFGTYYGLKLALLGQT